MNGPLKLDNRPLYVRAVEAVKTLIAQYPYSPGQQLPNEDNLATLLGISRTTLRMALGHLELQGVIVRRQGVGTFVAPQENLHLRGGLESLRTVQSLAEAAGLSTETSRREVSSVAADKEWAELLGVTSGVDLTQVRFTISVDSLPIATLHSQIPAATVAPADVENESGSLLDYLIRSGENSPRYTNSQVFAIEAGRALAERLRVPEGKAVLYLVETYFDAADQVLAVSKNYFVSDRYTFFINRQISA